MNNSPINSTTVGELADATSLSSTYFKIVRHNQKIIFN